MSPKERTVVRAVARALRANVTIDMDALATSYEVPPHYAISTPKKRAAMLLEALTKEKTS